MKLNRNFIVYETDGKQILVSNGKTSFSGIVRNNKSAAFLIKCLQEETTEEEIIEKMKEHFDGPDEVMRKDVRRVLDSLREIGALDE